MSPGNDRARPLARDGRTVESSGQLADESNLPPGWPFDTAVDPLALKGVARDAFYSGWASGYADGLNRGRCRGWAARVEAEQAAWQTMAARIRAAGGPFAGVRFSELAELRGEHEAAGLARARERLLFERVHPSGPVAS